MPNFLENRWVETFGVSKGMLLLYIRTLVFEIKFDFFRWRGNTESRHRNIVGFERQFLILRVIRIFHRRIQIMHFDKGINRGCGIGKLVRNEMLHEGREFQNLSCFRKCQKIGTDKQI